MRFFRSALLFLSLNTSGCLAAKLAAEEEAKANAASQHGSGDADDTDVEGDDSEEPDSSDDDTGTPDEEEPVEEDPEETPTTVDTMEMSILVEIYRTEGDLLFYDECQAWFTIERDPFNEGDSTYWVWENILSVGHGVPCGGASIDVWHFGIRQEPDSGTFVGNMEVDFIDGDGDFSNSGEYPEYTGIMNDSYESPSLYAEFSHEFVGRDERQYRAWFTVTTR